MKNIIIIFLLITSIAFGSPSNPLMQLEHTDKGHPKVSLEDLDVISMKKIAAFNDPLKKEERWQIPDIGYYYSYNIDVVQGNEPTENISFINIQIPESIGNKTLNFTNIDSSMDINSIPYY